MVFASLKNDKTRVLRPAAYVMDLFQTQWIAQEKERAVFGDDWAEWDGQRLCFTMPTGVPISQSSLRYHFKKLATDIGIPDCRVHDLRHPYVKTATTHFLRNFKERFCFVSIAVNP